MHSYFIVNDIWGEVEMLALKQALLTINWLRLIQLALLIFAVEGDNIIVARTEDGALLFPLVDSVSYSRLFTGHFLQIVIYITMKF